MPRGTLWSGGKKNNGTSFFWFYLFGFGSVVSQDGKGEKIGNRPIHPREPVHEKCAKNEETQNNSPSLQCIAEGYEYRDRHQKKMHSKKVGMQRLED